MNVYLWSFLIVSLMYWLRLYDGMIRDIVFNIQPDADRYMECAEGRQRLMRPWSMRWLFILFLRYLGPKKGGKYFFTKIMLYNYGWFALMSFALPYFLFSIGLTPLQALVAVGIYIGLGSSSFYTHSPHLADQPALFMIVLSAGLYFSGHPIIALLITTVAVGFKEVSPVIIAAMTLQPAFLIPMLMPVVGYFKDSLYAKTDYRVNPRGRVEDQRKPNQQYKYLKKELLNYKIMVSPWGIALFALLSMNPFLLASLVVAYSQIFIASDRTRLYQYAFPWMVAQASIVIVTHFSFWIPLLLLAHYYLPMKYGEWGRRYYGVDRD